MAGGAIQNDGVVDEKFFRKSEMVALDRRRLALFAQQAAVEAANGRGFVVREPDSVGLFWQFRQQRPVERGMSAERRRQDLVAGVGNLEAHVEMNVIDRV